MALQALSLIEFASLARGLRALDALVKKAPVEILEANLVEPGKFLVLFAWGVAEVTLTTQVPAVYSLRSCRPVRPNGGPKGAIWPDVTGAHPEHPVL